MTNKPKISVLVPMYNASKYINPCLDSILGQTYTNIQVLAVDDGSTDDTFDIVKIRQEKDSRIVLFHKENEKNVSKTRNFLLSKIDTDYFVFVDSDDRIEPTYIEDLYSNMVVSNSDLSICNFAFEFGKPKRLSTRTAFSKVYNRDDGIAEMILGRNAHFMLWNKLYKTKLLHGITFDENIRYGEDLLFVYKYAKNCNSISYFHKKLYHYVIHKNSEMRSKFGDKQLSLIPGLKQMVVSEQDETLSNILKAWYAFTCVGDLYYARQAKYDIPLDIKTMMKADARLYKSCLLKNKKARKIYKLIYRILSVFYL